MLAINLSKEPWMCASYMAGKPAFRLPHTTGICADDRAGESAF
jgi:hypothetical protein